MKVFEPISPIIFSDAIKKTRLAKAGMKMGAEKGYLGSSAEATSELGEIHLEEGAEILMDSTEKLYKDEELPQMSKEMRFVLRFLVRLS